MGISTGTDSNATGRLVGVSINMREITHTFDCFDGVHTVELHVYSLSAVEAIDVYELDARLFDGGGYRIEATVNGVPRGTHFFSNRLGSRYIGDSDDGRDTAVDVMTRARQDGFLAPVPRSAGEPHHVN